MQQPKALISLHFCICSSSGPHNNDIHQGGRARSQSTVLQRLSSQCMQLVMLSFAHVRLPGHFPVAAVRSSVFWEEEQHERMNAWP